MNITVSLTLDSVLVMLDLYKGVTALLKWQIPHLYKRLAMIPLQNNQELNDSKHRVELTLLGDVLEDLAYLFVSLQQSNLKVTGGHGLVRMTKHLDASPKISSKSSN